jgi:hypothetical protein
MLRHIGDDAVLWCWLQLVVENFAEAGTHHDDFKTPWNHHGTVFCGQLKASRWRNSMLLSAAQQPLHPQCSDHHHCTSPPVSTTTNSLISSTSLLSRRATICQSYIGCSNHHCFQGGAGAPAELVRSSCSRLVDKGVRQHDYTITRLRRSSVRLPTTTTKNRRRRRRRLRQKTTGVPTGRLVGDPVAPPPRHNAKRCRS